MNSFQTCSTARKSVITIIFTFIPMFALAFLGLKIAVITWLFFEGVLLFSFGLCMFFVTKTHWEIEFQNNNIILLNSGNHQSYYLENLIRSDIIIKQSKAQIRKNRCDIKIKNTPFGIYDVKHHNEMLKYIQENIPC